MKKFSTLIFIVLFSFPSTLFAATFEEHIGKVAKELVKNCPALKGKTVAVPLFPDVEGNRTCLGKFLAEVLTNKLANLGKKHGFQVKERLEVRQLELDLNLTNPEHDIDKFFACLQTDFLLVGSYLFPEKEEVCLTARILLKDGKVCASVTKRFKISKEMRALSEKLLFPCFAEQIIALGEGKRKNRLKIYRVLKNGKKIILSCLRPYVYTGERIIIEIDMPFSGYVYLLNFNAKEAVILYPLVGIASKLFSPGKHRFPDVVSSLIKEFKVCPPVGRAVFEVIFVRKTIGNFLEGLKKQGAFYELTAKECHRFRKKLLDLPKETIYIESQEIFIRKAENEA